MTTFLSWLRQLNFDTLLDTLIVVLASLLCITVHESCHGLAAYWLGDDTAKRMGRISLNPLRHIDIGGLIMMAIFHFVWAKPVPIASATAAPAWPSQPSPALFPTSFSPFWP